MDNQDTTVPGKAVDRPKSIEDAHRHATMGSSTAKQLVDLHAKLRQSLGCDYVDQESPWSRFYLDCIRLPPLLSAAITTFMLLECYGERRLLEDLILGGKESRTFSVIWGLWKGMPEGLIKWDPGIVMTPDSSFFCMLDEIEGGPERTPLEVAAFLNHPFIDRDILFLGRPLKQSIRRMKLTSEEMRCAWSLNDEAVNALLSVMSGCTPLWNTPQRWVMETFQCPEEEIRRLLGTAVEYNLDWALAAFEWGDNGDMIAGFQEVVDASPWVGYTELKGDRYEA